jgi:hypothetical protein
MLCYTGIGSREISTLESNDAKLFAQYMAKCGLTLYTGDAEGSDDAFLKGAGDNHVIWTPFSKPYLKHLGKNCIQAGDTEEGRRWTEECHPNPVAVKIKAGSLALINRDAHQVIGMPPMYPQTLFVVYIGTWVGGNNLVKGGTGQAVRIATKLGIPTFNLRGNTFGSALKFAEQVLGAIK